MELGTSSGFLGSSYFPENPALNAGIAVNLFRCHWISVLPSLKRRGALQTETNPDLL